MRCIKGEIFDVAVDIRKNSPTFGKYVSAILSEENKNMLYIPRGFAHGFEVLSNEAEVIYGVDNFYSKESESGIRWDNQKIDIKWPLKTPLISSKDDLWPKKYEISNIFVLLAVQE